MYRPLNAEEKAIVDRLANEAPEQLPMAMQVCLGIGDYDTCTYITAKHFEKLPADVQAHLKAAGLKEVSDLMCQLEEALLGTPEAAVMSDMEQAMACLAPASSLKH
jgi:hypothetical protein